MRGRRAHLTSRSARVSTPRRATAAPVARRWGPRAGSIAFSLFKGAPAASDLLRRQASASASSAYGEYACGAAASPSSAPLRKADYEEGRKSLGTSRSGRGRLCAALLAALLWTACLAAQGTPAGEAFREVRFQGNHAFPDKKLYEVTGLSRPSRLRLFKGHASTSRAELESRIQELLLFYQRGGYFEARAELEAEGEGKALILIREGPPGRVSTVDLRLAPAGAPAPVPLSILQRRLPVQPGQVFSAQSYGDAAQMLERAWQDRGFPFAQVSPEAVADVAAHQVAVSYTITPGEAMRFGPVTLEGVIHTEPLILRRALAFRTNEPFDQRKVEKSIENLYRLGLFDLVNINLKKRGGPPGMVPVVVRVKEGRHRRLQGSLGYGTEEGPRGSLSWETLRVDDRVVDIGTAFRTSDLVTEGSLWFRRPYFWTSDNWFNADLTYGRRVENSFNYRSARARVGLDHTFSDRWTGALYLVGERVLQVTPDLALDQALSAGARDVATMGSVAASVTYRSTDDPISPSRGLLATLSAEPTHVLTTGGNFTKTDLALHSYFPLSHRWVLALRMELGAILTNQKPSQIPITRRFYAGGANSLRGYKYDSLGPLSKDGALLGGSGLALASAELRFPLPGELTGLVFLDAGNALKKPLDFKGATLYSGTGFGIRYKTPVGPLGADLAWKLKKDPRDPSAYLLYFFIGYAF